MTKVLIVDDEEEVRSYLSDLLIGQGLDVVTAEDGRVALERIRTDAPSLVLLDLEMPRLGGMEVLATLNGEHSRVPVIVLTAHGEVPKVVEAMRLGAYDYLTKPFLAEELLLRVSHVLERQTLLTEVETLRDQLGTEGLREQMGPSREIERLAQHVRLVAASSFSVLIEGETGAGKEVVARAIHHQSERRDRRFVALDCGAMPESLIESELFGYEKGAFTGADRRKKGYFHLADGGTLFLDEITNMPSSIQAKLLRALQEREVQPLGGKEPIPVDVRIIAASNIPLEAEARAGRFRQDLFYRLNEFILRIPPLRERRDDILYLAQRFLEEVSMELRRPAQEISEDAARLLRGYAWPGNARELKNVIRRAALLASGPVTPEHLGIIDLDPAATAAAAGPKRSRPGLSLKEIAETAAAEAEREAIRQALEAARGNKSEAARLLGTEYKTLHLKMRRYGIPARDGPGA